MIASCKTSCAHKQEHAELESVKLALALASHTRNFLQQLGMDQLGKDVHIGLRTSSLNEELVTGRPIAMQLGLSRRNKHIQLRGQLQLSKIHPDKNLAHSLTNNASGKRVLAKLRVDTGAAETLALSTVRGHSFASFVLSSSLLVGMVNLEPPKMESLQLRQLALSKSETCLESLSKNLADKSLASLTLPSLSFQRSNSQSLTLPSLNRQEDRFHSLTLHSLSLTRGNLESLTLQSLSLIAQNRFPRISFKELLFGTGSLKELEENLAHKLANRRAETNSFSNLSFEEMDQLAEREAETNSFSNSSLQKWILSLRMCLQIFQLRSFQLVCAALSLGYLVSMCFQSLIEQLCSKSFHTLSNQLGISILESLIIQLDLVTSLSLPEFSLTRCRHQLQSTSFDKSSFEHRALPGTALLSECHSQQLQILQFQSFQLTMVQLSQHTTQGGVHLRAFSKIASTTRASTLISLSFAQDAWLKSSSRTALRSRPLRQRSLRRSGPATAWPATTSTTASKTTTKSLRRTLLTMLLFSFFISNSFWRKELEEHNELSQTVQFFPLDPLHDHLGKELWTDQLQQNLCSKTNKNNKLDHNQVPAKEVPDRELSQLHLSQLHDQDQPFRGTKQLPEEECLHLVLSDR